MAQAAKSQEPSMEEILASIRRIIAEDDSDKLAQRPAETGEVGEAVASSLGAPRSLRDPVPQETTSTSNDASGGTPKASRASTILDLTEATSPAARTTAFDPTPAPVQAAPIEDADAAAPESQASAAREDERGRLVSSTTSAAVDSAFNALAQTVLVHNARTLEDLVREMLRPMLKVWLDDNLPGMVERLVRAEIERVSRGR
jgi:uncharacterized protein